jgi:hypothetical protein
MNPATAHITVSIPIRRRTKVAAGLRACFFGAFGVHWWYLGRRGAWLISAFALACLGLSLRYPVWYDSPVFFLLFIPMVDGFIEGVVLCLFTDEKFDRLYNPDLPPSPQTGWGPVLVALLSTLMGAVLSMFAIAMVVMHVYIAMGWLDGLVI